MAMLMRCANVTVLTFLFVLVQLCSADGHADPPTSNENKITSHSSSASMRNSAGKTSKNEELRERAELVDLPRTCGNLGRKQQRNELLAYLTKQISKSYSSQDRWKTARPKSGSANMRTPNVGRTRLRRGVNLSDENTERLKKHVVYSTAVNLKKNTVKFILNASEIIDTPVIIKLWIFNEKKRCPLRKRVYIDLSSREEENKNCVFAMESKRYHDLVKGKYHDSEEEGWVSFDVSQLTEKVMRNLKNVCNNADKVRLGFKLKTPKCSFLGRTKKGNSNLHQPYMEILPKQPVGPLECTPGEKRCCRQKTTVMLTELGEIPSSILAPTAFRNGYCKGSCVGQPSKRQNGPCCVPTETTPMSALYMDRARVGLMILRDVVVKECGCR